MDDGQCLTYHPVTLCLEAGERTKAGGCYRAAPPCKASGFLRRFEAADPSASAAP